MNDNISFLEAKDQEIIEKKRKIFLLIIIREKTIMKKNFILKTIMKKNFILSNTILLIPTIL